MKRSIALGIDIGGTNTVYGFIDEKGNVLYFKEIPTNGNKPIDDLIGRIETAVNDFLTNNIEETLVGIGIGAPNGNYFSGKIQDPPNLSWGSVDVVSYFTKRFNCTVQLTNDANAAALGEKYFGVAKTMDNFVVITLGTGLGSGIFSGGKLVYGHDGFAGEMGHISIDYNGRICNCGNIGCLEAYVSASGIKKTVGVLRNKYPEDVLLKKLDKVTIDGELLDQAFDNDNLIAKEIYNYTGEKLGQGLALVATLLSPEAFIFYGGFSNAGHRLLNPAKLAMDRHLINNQSESIHLLQSGLPKGKAGILGAASLIWNLNN
tara:strand:+ start:17880 stop:18833 length:954 start_codon:yes stop_codon:yes gene_type:complete